MYKKPTYANAFYVVRMLPRQVEEGLLGHEGVEVSGVLETLEGVPCVTVAGLVPKIQVKTMTAGIEKIVDTEKVKAWVGWPSRSQRYP